MELQYLIVIGSGVVLSLVPQREGEYLRRTAVALEALLGFQCAEAALSDSDLNAAVLERFTCQ